MSVFVVVDFQVFDLHARPFQQVYSVGRVVLLLVDHAADARLDDELGALDAGGGGDVEGSALAAVGGAGHLRDGVGLGV